MEHEQQQQTFHPQQNGSGIDMTNILSIKFLVSNSLAGSLIGTGGSAIKELIEFSEARVNISDPQELFPGTSDRVVLISGIERSVTTAQSLIWLMFAQNVKAVEEGNNKSVSWSPRVAAASSDEYNGIEVEGKITIPAAAGGLILGRGGSTIKSIGEESGARIQMTGKDDAMFTQERVLTISGNVSSCAKCTTLILGKLAEDEESARFVNRGTTYSSQIGNMFGGGDRRTGRGGSRGNSHATAIVDGSGGDISASTTITLAIPDNLVGNILGKQGATMREIMSLSGAKVVVSPRGEFVEGTSNRLVTITGAPSCAQTAHYFVSQKLQVQQPRRFPKNSEHAI